jgi:hypothetical protein
MPKKHSEAETARIALAKAQGQRVYISGLSGHHTLETGVAYHYRGHYVYSYPQGMPIDPVPFQTKQGINIRANPLRSAPPYDSNAPGLVSESSINALNKTWGAMWEEQKSGEEMRKKEVAEAIEDEEGHLGSKALSELPAMPYATSLVPTQVSSRMGSRAGSRTDLSSLAVPTLCRSSSRPGSSSASFAAHDAHSRSSSTSLAALDPHVGYTRSSSATIPGLGHSSSHQDLHASSSSLTTLRRDFGNLHLQVSQPNTGTAPGIPSISAYAPSSIYGENISDSLSRLRNDFYTPHDRARFLSDSAPGSRLASVTNTPYTSRPVSPTHQHPRASNTLRQVASTTRLSQLLAEDLTPRALVHCPLSKAIPPRCRPPTMANLEHILILLQKKPVQSAPPAKCPHRRIAVTSRSERAVLAAPLSRSIRLITPPRIPAARVLCTGRSAMGSQSPRRGKPDMPRKLLGSRSLFR